MSRPRMEDTMDPPWYIMVVIKDIALLVLMLTLTVTPLRFRSGAIAPDLNQISGQIGRFWLRPVVRSGVDT